MTPEEQEKQQFKKMREALIEIATLDESPTEDLLESLTNWDSADVYKHLARAIETAREALKK